MNPTESNRAYKMKYPHVLRTCQWGHTGGVDVPPHDCQSYPIYADSGEEMLEKAAWNTAALIAHMEYPNLVDTGSVSLDERLACIVTRTEELMKSLSRSVGRRTLPPVGTTPQDVTVTAA